MSFSYFYASISGILFIYIHSQPAFHHRLSHIRIAVGAAEVELAAVFTLVCEAILALEAVAIVEHENAGLQLGAQLELHLQRLDGRRIGAARPARAALLRRSAVEFVAVAIAVVAGAVRRVTSASLSAVRVSVCKRCANAAYSPQIADDDRVNVEEAAAVEIAGDHLVKVDCELSDHAPIEAIVVRRAAQDLYVLKFVEFAFLLCLKHPIADHFEHKLDADDRREGGEEAGKCLRRAVRAVESARTLQLTMLVAPRATASFKQRRIAVCASSTSITRRFDKSNDSVVCTMPRNLQSSNCDIPK